MVRMKALHDQEIAPLPTVFDGDDGLPRNADCLRQLLLGHFAMLEAKAAYVVTNVRLRHQAPTR